MKLRCQCGKEVEDWRGARGHVKFTNDDDHGDYGEIGDDYRDMFTEGVEDDPTQDEGEKHEPPADGEPGDWIEDDQTDAEPEESQSEESEPSESRLKKLLTTPVNELIGGGE